ncbi:MAG TPA: hypothetical protein IGS17_14315 [Oscillatoriales cyanobacterium M59_W2019_021]|nr:hypothetical protein [Oscillatoriales cyanobacterium M4454_W2019_049]HIK52077.1 hypothetical protein [Oscillatoriales cyanobacterium M59_W2019_021]
MAKTLTLQLPDELDRLLAFRATQLNLSLEALVLQTLTQLLAVPQSQQPVLQWSEIVLTFTGIPDFPPFESSRDELLPPREPEML